MKKGILGTERKARPRLGRREADRDSRSTEMWQKREIERRDTLTYG